MLLQNMDCSEDYLPGQKINFLKYIFSSSQKNSISSFFCKKIVKEIFDLGQYAKKGVFIPMQMQGQF